MGPVRDNEKKKTIEPIQNNLDADLNDFDTQPVDDEISLLSDELCGGFSGKIADGFQYLENTVPVGEFFSFGDAFETQMVDLDCETQVAELCGETQPVDLDGFARVNELYGENQPADLDGCAQVDEFCGETQLADLDGCAQVDELCGETQQVDLVECTGVDELCGATQAVHIGGHTQLDELGGETLAEDLGCETQVLDDCETEALVDSDDKGGGETEVFCDTQVISEENSTQRSGNCSVSTGLNKESRRDSRAESDALNNGERHSGSKFKGFTSIRSASIRASGLEARNMALKRNNKTSCSACDNSLEPQNADKDGRFVSRCPLKFGNECNVGNQNNSMVDSRELLELGNERKQSDQKHTQQEHDQQIQPRNENSRKLGSSIARKLFMDDNASDIRQMDAGMNNADNTDLPLVFASKNDLGGLSYVDSQEPGELSQANALEVVDKIVKLNMIESVEKAFFEGSTHGKSKPVSCAKGTRSLAKKAASRMRQVENAAFSWDDNLEDEGGGEFFQKKKELFFDGGSQRRKSHKPSRKSWCQKPKSGMIAQEIGDEQLNNRNLKDAFLSDSRLLSKSLSLNSKSRELTEASLKKNLMKDLDEEKNAASGERQADVRKDTDAPEELDVGLDTQMAADAMEALRFAASGTDNDGSKGIKKVKKSSRGGAGNKSNLEQNLNHKEVCSSGAVAITRQCKRARTTVESHTELSILSCKQSKNSGMKLDAQLEKRGPKSGKLDQRDFVENMRDNLRNASKMVGQRKEDKIEGTCAPTSGGPKSLKNLPMQDQYESYIPVAHRTRGSMQIIDSQCGNSFRRSGEHVDVIGHVSQRKGCRTKADTSKDYGDKADPAGKLGNMDVKQPNFVEHPRRRRTRSRSALVGQEETIEFNKRSKISEVDDKNTSANKDVKKHLNVGGGISIQASVNRNTSGNQEDVIQTKSSMYSVVKRHKDNKRSAEGEKVNSSPEASSENGHKSAALESATPVSCATPVNDVSPICKGDEYHKQSCRKNLLRSSLSKEINSLLNSGPERTFAMKDSRRRRDMTNVRVLFSRHLDANTIKQQKKILNRLGASVASSTSDASHFVTDEFARTRNMLEAIAFGKPVVTHLWLESCGQAGCFIDERSYILRDERKEKEFGFRMPVSLARASQYPLLQGQRVLITPSTKPGKELLASLVKAVHGLAVERLGRSSLKDEKFPDDLLVLSCEEDYEICVPFLEKGAAIYSSELLLNGIVTQRLDYERHELFTDNVKRTRSTIWLKRENNVYTPVCKSK